MKHQDIISKMTLDEKASLLSGKGNFGTKTVERLGVPAMYLSDGPHGIRKQAGDTDHLGLNASLPATCFPTAATVANSWNPELGEKIGEALGEEAVSQRVNVLLGPGLNMKRSPLCGRNFEYFSEDPYLAGKMAAAYIRGIQSRGISACPKHFAANSQELLRMSSDSVVDERTFHEIYLTGFEIAVKEGHPKTIMSAYNMINGVYANENRELLRDILVDDWGFDGMVVSDWGGSNDHVAGVKAGAHLEMPAAGPDTDRQLVDAVKNGTLDENVLDERLDEYLTVLFDTVIPDDAPRTFDHTAHHKMAQQAAEESIVLLQNENDLLPLKTGTTVALIGDFAKTPRYQGAGSSVVNATQLDNAWGCIDDSGLKSVGYQPGFLRTGGADTALLLSACELAKTAEVALVFLGLDELSESEGMDRTHMRLAKNQTDLLHAVCQVNPNVVVILCCGAAVESSYLDDCRAAVHGYLPGQAGAQAILDVLTGQVNPSGKLSETYPVSYEDTPAYKHFPGVERTAEYREGLYIGYRYYDTAEIPVRFPFGFGLSYTTFSYSDCKVTDKAVTFTLQNTGKVAGAEVTQLYVSLPSAAIFRPKKELKGFSKVFLQPGEAKTVTIPLDDKAFRYYNVKTRRFEIEGGHYLLQVGSSSADMRLGATLTVAGTNAPNPYEGKNLPSYQSGKVSDVPDGEFEELLGRPIPPALWDRTKPLGRNDAISQLSYAKSGIARFVYRTLEKKKAAADAKGAPDLNIMFIYNMPFRGIAKMAGGMVSLDMVDGILTLVNGHFFRGLGQVISGFFSMKKADKKTAAALQNAGKEGSHG
ncbi:MAG: glycoside hydrolase family 3 C-terminal domain-containing protein [Oscillospiraceae bacterium]